MNAVVWPMLWVLLIQHAPEPAGMVRPFVTAMVVLPGLERLHRALCVNQRDWFTTWRWGKVMAPTDRRHGQAEAMADGR